uniref:Uncharacterized protein n=1 Tax=Pararge aegeria TaxID=116150 RepID=S4PBT8_9NEOP
MVSISLSASSFSCSFFCISISICFLALSFSNSFDARSFSTCCFSVSFLVSSFLRFSAKACNHSCPVDEFGAAVGHTARRTFATSAKCCS